MVDSNRCQGKSHVGETQDNPLSMCLTYSSSLDLTKQRSCTDYERKVTSTNLASDSRESPLSDRKKKTFLSPFKDV